MAQYDADSVVVYQAYAPAIGHFAVENSYLGGGEYSLNRMSWIKPNFLWMMHRSGWGTKHGQEVILAIKIKRSGFESILEQAVHSSFIPNIYGTITAWKDALENSQVRLQWDPDYDPLDNRLERRAMQLGLSGEILAQYAQGGWIIDIEDVTPLAHTQRGNAQVDRLEQLVLPKEAVYPVIHPELAKKLQLSPTIEQ
jgi:hypothetical protein